MGWLGGERRSGFEAFQQHLNRDLGAEAAGVGWRCTFFFTMASPPPTGWRKVQAASAETGASSSSALPLSSAIRRDMDRLSGLVEG